MVGKPNLPADAEIRTDVMGSAVSCYQNALDQERAASMADEGGAAGAHAETLEPDWPGLGLAIGQPVRSRLQRVRPWLLRAAAAALAALATGWLLRRRA